MTTEVIQIHRLYEEIVKSSRQYHADFIFKPVRQHGPLKRMFYTSTDWNLIRMSPTSRLLRGKPVIASVNIGDEDPALPTKNSIGLFFNGQPRSLKYLKQKYI